MESTIASIPSPGIYPGIPSDVYHSWDCASASRLKRLRKSPAHYRYYVDNPEESDTEALVFGRAYHDAILQPEVFQREYIIAKPCSQELKSGDRKGKPCGLPGIAVNGNGQWLCGRHGKGDVLTGSHVLSPNETDEIEEIRSKVLAHPMASELLNCKGVCETSLVWRDCDTGVLCKGRVDRYCTFRGWRVHLDLKGTTDASEEGFAREVARHGYHIQAAMYLDGTAAIRVANRRYVFIAVEKTPPYCVGVYELDAFAISCGRAEYKRLLQLLRECQETDHWPDYTTDQITKLSLPTWAT